MNRSSKLVVFVIFLLFAVYQVNFALSFIELPGFFADIESWILFVGGLLLAFGGFSYYRLKTMQGL